MIRGKPFELARGKPLVDVLPGLLPTMVRIDLLKCDGTCQKIGHGSGYFGLHNGEVVVYTVFHVADPQYTIQATTQDGRSFPLKFAIGGPERDMAICTVEGDGEVACAPNVVLDKKSRPRTGEESFAIGCPLGLNWSTTFGRFSAIRDNEPWPGQSEPSCLLQVDYSINGGNSGGPVFVLPDPRDASTIRTVGSVSYGYSPGGGGSVGLNFAVSSEHYAEMLGALASDTTKRLGCVEVRPGLFCIDTAKGVMVHRVTRSGASIPEIVPCSVPTSWSWRTGERVKRALLPQALRRDPAFQDPPKRHQRNPNPDWSKIVGVGINDQKMPVSSVYDLMTFVSAGRKNRERVRLVAEGSVSGKLSAIEV